TNFAQFGIGSNVTPGDGQSATAPPTRVIGYYQARGDIYPLAAGGYNNQAFRPTVQASGGTVWVVAGNNGLVAENLVVDGNNQAASVGVYLAANSTARNCLARNCTTSGINLGGNCAAIDCEVTGCLVGATAVHCSTGSIVANCHVHDNACPGIYAGSGNAAIVDNLVVNNTGAGSDGVQVGGNSLVLRNTIRGNGRHGIYVVSSSNFGYHFRDNVLALNGGYGLVGALAAGIAASPAMDGNAYYGNTSGARQYADDTTVQPINGVAPYANRLDVACTASPFLADTGTASTSNFGLNSAAGGGALCKGLGTPQAWPLGTATAPTTSAANLGASQSPASGGGISKGRLLGGD
ncbi:MAG TPA: right-handed parallel beta-helix repeat-containing protein, partial [Isosphaeraceae bacterium]|nr:right-handed parallel beta-helix repeat-containing protein [Isosphaeraceae bacterium]